MASNNCIHHWFIDEPDREGNQFGVCRKCDEARQFGNIFRSDPFKWDGDHVHFSTKDHERAEERAASRKGVRV